MHTITASALQFFRHSTSEPLSRFIPVQRKTHHRAGDLIATISDRAEAQVAPTTEVTETSCSNTGQPHAHTSVEIVDQSARDFMMHLTQFAANRLRLMSLWTAIRQSPSPMTKLTHSKLMACATLAQVANAIHPPERDGSMRQSLPGRLYEVYESEKDLE